VKAAVVRGGGLRSASRKPGGVPAAVSLVSGDPAGHSFMQHRDPGRVGGGHGVGHRPPPGHAGRVGGGYTPRPSPASGLQVRPPSYAPPGTGEWLGLPWQAAIPARRA